MDPTRFCSAGDLALLAAGMSAEGAGTTERAPLGELTAAARFGPASAPKFRGYDVPTRASCGECGEPYAGEGVCEACGAEYPEDDGSETVAIATPKTLLTGLRVMGGDTARTAQIREIVSGGVGSIDTKALGAALFEDLAHDSPDSPLGAPDVRAAAAATFSTIVSLSQTTRPSVGMFEKLLGGCLYYAAVSCQVSTNREKIVAFVKRGPQVVRARCHGLPCPASLNPTGFVQSINTVGQQMRDLGLKSSLPSPQEQDLNQARSVVREYLDVFWRRAEVVSPLAAVFVWAGTIRPASAKTPADVIGPAAETALAQVLYELVAYITGRGIGSNRNQSTQWAACAALVLEAYAAMGLGGEDDLPQAKYGRVAPEFAPAGDALAFQLGLAASVSHTHSVLRQPRSRKTVARRRPFPPKGKLLALRRKTVSDAVTKFVAQLWPYRRDINAVVFARRGMYLPRPAYWRRSGLARCGVSTR